MNDPDETDWQFVALVVALTLLAFAVLPHP